MDIITNQELYSESAVQRHILGISALDYRGDLWDYCWASEALNPGEWVEDQRTSDLLSGATGTVTTAQAAATNKLIDSGEFTGDDFIGALGVTLGDTIANGGGQGFYVVKMIDANTIEVYVLHSATARVANGKWATALTISTTYSLWLPGRVKKGAAQPNVPRGVAQIAITDEYFFWAKRTGEAWVKQDVSEDPFVVGEPVTGIASGMAEGFTAAGTTADEINYILGISLLGDLAGSVDGLTLVDLRIPKRSVSYRWPSGQPRY